MEFTFPNYYKEFSCIAGSCPDTCCAGWQIVIDNKTLKKYQHFKGPFHNRLHNDIDWKEHVFRQYNRRCAFLNEENLCDIYTEAGPKMLCDTCRNYPRHIEEFEGLREISLSLSCPEAARILLSQKEKVHSRMNTSDTSKDLFKNMWKTIVPEMEVLRPGWKEFLKERLDSLYISSGENDYIYQKSEFDFYCPESGRFRKNSFWFTGFILISVVQSMTMKSLPRLKWLSSVLCLSMSLMSEHI